MKEGPLYLGVDCGGTNLRAAVADSEGHLIAELLVPTGDAAERQNGLGEAIRALVGELASRLPHGSALRGLGVGLPFVCHEGSTYLYRNVEALDPTELELRLSRDHGAPVVLANDVKCAALGEGWLGSARGADPFLYVNVGTGLSSALYAGGRLLEGAHHAAGEIAYWVTEADDPVGLATGIGPLEEALSGVGLSGSYARSSGEHISAEEIFRRAALGESLASSLVERGLGYLLPALSNLAAFADPELLVLGGGISRSLVREGRRIEAYLARMTPFPPRLAFSELGGNAGLLGALRFAMLAAEG